MGTDEAELEQQVARGAAVYTPLMLSVYDWWVYGMAVRVMRCPRAEMFTFYDLNVSEHHLDIGVGSGLLLKHCQQQNLLERVALMDLNPNCLNATEKSLRSLPVQKYQADMLKPFPIDNEQFLSVGLNFLLHCVPGSFKEKGIVFQYIKKVMATDGVVFGSTAVYQPGIRYAAARFLMDRYNHAGIFNNKQDKQEDLQQVLGDLFCNVEFVQEGCVLFFRASDGRLE